MLLADIGNTNFHIYNGKTVEHLSYDDAIAKYQSEVLSYISVKHQLSSEIKQIENWKNISSLMRVKNEYNTMGVDRKASVFKSCYGHFYRCRFGNYCGCNGKWYLSGRVYFSRYKSNAECLYRYILCTGC